MRIVSLTLRPDRGSPQLSLNALDAGINVLFGPTCSGKSTLADLVTHALYGRRLLSPNLSPGGDLPAGEVSVESAGRKFRLRRCHDQPAKERLTVAALDGSPVDHNTVQQLVSGLSPALLGPLFAVNFRESPRLGWLLAPPFAREFRAALSQLKWAPPKVDQRLRPLHARLRALELELVTLVRALGFERNELPWTAPLPKALNHGRRASDFLTRLTAGELVRLQLKRREPSGQGGPAAHVLNRAGDSLSLDSVTPAQRNQIYLSLCLALVSACSRFGVDLPLVLDEPFSRLDRRATASLAEVLADFGSHGHQLLVFTASAEAAERFATLNATVHRLSDPQRIEPEPAIPFVPAAKVQVADATRREKRRTVSPTEGVRPAKKKRREAG